MRESNFESVRVDVYKHMVKEGLLAGAIIFGTFFLFYFGLKLSGNQHPATGYVLFFVIAYCYFGFKIIRRQMAENNENQLSEDEPLKPLWGNGDEIFAKEWVLSLSTKVPKVSFVLEDSVEKFYRKLGYYHSAAKA